MNILVFEDKQVPLLYPVTTGRPAYAVYCGGFRLVDWLQQLNGKLTGLVRSHLTTSQLLDYPMFGSLDANEPWTLLVNARLVPSLSNVNLLKSLMQTPTAKVVRSEWTIAAAMMPTNQLRAEDPSVHSPVTGMKSADLDHVENYFAVEHLPSIKLQFDLIEYPHDILRAHLRCFAENLNCIVSESRFKQQQDGLFVGQDVQIADGLVVDTRCGPVVIDQGVAIGPHCFFRGPVYVGPNSRVIEHSSLKDNVCIAHTAKVGGEVEASIIDAYTNKQHHGFLGHSYLGTWINLGAGTCNSDLKNTYGEVKMEYGGKRVSTGMQFIGCMIGDYAKTAINTGIFTGKIVGTCSMLYGFVTTNVPSFVNYARSFGQVTEMSPAVMVATQKRMFERRNVTQRPCDVQLINDMFEMTRHERQLAEEPLAL